ncbi:calcyclin-binding protein [Orussus abietinus]|uniref:calcyclin-binding protein n=1 Tax=Orussus abietinus TaxID=222816 RepID=UPI000625EF8D|nr:calcyclin-binding protein [Orussus abietinus]XP_012283718.1 calcyclin-binding protein [Orussus abietinus]
MTTSRAEEIKLDIVELNALCAQANRQRSKDLLSLEVRRLQDELARITDETRLDESKTLSQTTSASSKCYEIKLTNYAWDQTDTFVKVYVMLKDVHTLPNDVIVCNFTDRSMDLRVPGLGNRNYQLPINNLSEEIDVSRSYVKVKTDKIVVFLAKKVPKNWTYITYVEKKIKEAKAPTMSDMGEDNDPGASLMNLMKKMYQDGDDEMKKTIAKAWTESQEKKSSQMSDFSL